MSGFSKLIITIVIIAVCFLIGSQNFDVDYSINLIINAATFTIALLIFKFVLKLTFKIISLIIILGIIAAFLLNMGFI